MNLYFVGGGSAVSNLDQVAYVEDVTKFGLEEDEVGKVFKRIVIAFAAVAPSPFHDDWDSPVPLSLSLENEDAFDFMSALMKRALEG